MVEVLRLNLGQGKPDCPVDDQLGRSGSRVYREGMSPREVYEIARGCWAVSQRRAARESHAVVVVASRVVGVFSIGRVVPVDRWREETVDRCALEGDPLWPGDELFDRWVGREVAWQRGPFSYVGDGPVGGSGRRACACGCGGEVLARSEFIAGHDQRAIHERIARVGSVREFLEWFDRVRPA